MQIAIEITNNAIATKKQVKEAPSLKSVGFLSYEALNIYPKLTKIHPNKSNRVAVVTII